ncbi:nucleotidyltransferase domain-containing protein [Curtobacterium sp. PhB130]|uniref:nucleotidyltransferase domain-containing protein n=1 Tax=Curtobacterium sp. PhB130 TaxID=2485178 RepID=UPI00161C0978
MSAHANVQVYGFGSFTRGESKYRDIDILVIYRNLEQLRAFLRDLYELPSDLPVDVISMTPEEERHFDFIRSEGARLVLGPAREV